MLYTRPYSFGDLASDLIKIFLPSYHEREENSVLQNEDFLKKYFRESRQKMGCELNVISFSNSDFSNNHEIEKDHACFIIKLDNGPLNPDLDSFIVAPQTADNVNGVRRLKECLKSHSHQALRDSVSEVLKGECIVVNIYGYEKVDRVSFDCDIDVAIVDCATRKEISFYRQEAVTKSLDEVVAPDWCSSCIRISPSTYGDFRRFLESDMTKEGVGIGTVVARRDGITGSRLEDPVEVDYDENIELEWYSRLLPEEEIDKER